jgi:hypothetical protein
MPRATISPRTQCDADLEQRLLPRGQGALHDEDNMEATTTTTEMELAMFEKQLPRVSIQLNSSHASTRTSGRDLVLSAQDFQPSFSQQMIGTALTRTSEGGKAAAATEGEPSLLYKALLLAILLPTAPLIVGVYTFLYETMLAVQEPAGPELYVTTVLFGCSWCTAWTFLHSTRIALAPEGPLERLLERCSWETHDKGAPRRRLTLEAHRSLARWRSFFHGLWLVATLCAVVVGLITLRSVHSLVAVAAVNFVMCSFCVIAFVLYKGWLPSLWLACKLCQDRIDEVVRSIDGLRGQQQADVEAPLLPATFDLALAKQIVDLDKYMQHLSNGWGGGMMGLTLICCGWALGFVSLALNQPYCKGFSDTDQGVTPGSAQLLHFTMAAMSGIVPILVSNEIVRTASCCQDVMVALNQARIANVWRRRDGSATAVETLRLIEEVETALERLNFRQGLGFKLPIVDIVINRWTARKAWVGLIGMVGTIYTALLVRQILGPEDLGHDNDIHYEVMVGSGSK